MFLPNEILDEIFDYLDPLTLRSARLAGRLLHEAASQALFCRWTFNVGDNLEECSSRMKYIASKPHLSQIRGIVASARGILPQAQPDSHLSFKQAIRRKLRQTVIDDSGKVSSPKVNREYLRIFCRQSAIKYFWHFKNLLNRVSPDLEKLYIQADRDPDADDKTKGYLTNLAGCFFLKMLTATIMAINLPALSYTRIDFHGALSPFFPNERSMRSLKVPEKELRNLQAFLDSVQYLGFKVGSMREVLPDPDNDADIYGTVREDNYAIALLDMKKVTNVAKKLQTLAVDYTGHDNLGYKLSENDFIGFPEKSVSNANFSAISFLRDIRCWDLNSHGRPNFVLRSIKLDNVCIRPEIFSNRWQEWGWGDIFRAILQERGLQTVTKVRFSRLSYFFLINSNHADQMRIPGWSYQRPLISDVDDDFEAFKRLRDGLICRREALSLDVDDWLSEFCKLPEVLKKMSKEDARKCIIM